MLQLRVQGNVTTRSLRSSPARLLRVHPTVPKRPLAINSLPKSLSSFAAQFQDRLGKKGSANSPNAIGDEYSTVEEVQAALRKSGLEASNLILAIDFTESNNWSGQDSFGGKSLHTISKGTMNPYQQAIASISETLSAFDNDQLIPCYGFGDLTTGAEQVFSFKQDDEPCKGLKDVQATYARIAAAVKLSGPTSFAPAIYQAIKVVFESGNRYHILLLLADGQVSDEEERATINAIVQASNYPLSIVMVGLGDGPWDMMKKFDDRLPRRRFDNFQFVNFTQIASRYRQDPEKLKAQFALSALMEIPAKYQAIRDLKLMSTKQQRSFEYDEPAPPPIPTKKFLFF